MIGDSENDAAAAHAAAVPLVLMRYGYARADPEDARRRRGARPFRRAARDPRTARPDAVISLVAGSKTHSCTPFAGVGEPLLEHLSC